MFQGSREGMGKHVLLNMYECGNLEKLERLSEYQEFILELLKDSRAEVLSTVSHQFPGGFTHLALLTTSHCSIHTWPEWGSAAVDVFTCGEVDTDRIVQGIVEYFDSLRHWSDCVLR
jgi:S-adenosylmethionine decarboxylase